MNLTIVLQTNLQKPIEEMTRSLLTEAKPQGNSQQIRIEFFPKKLFRASG